LGWDWAEETSLSLETSQEMVLDAGLIQSGDRTGGKEKERLSCVTGDNLAAKKTQLI